jgi:hypothetical protein
VDTVLGLLVMLVWVVGTIALAAAVTWIVVKVSPGGDSPPKPADAPAEA